MEKNVSCVDVKAISYLDAQDIFQKNVLAITKTNNFKKIISV